MPLEGTLSYRDLAHLLQVVGSSKKSGVLEIRHEDRVARLVFREGRLIRAESNQRHPELGELLVRAGALSPPDLQRALTLQRATGEDRRLGTLLCEEFGVAPETIQEVLARQFREIVFDVLRWPGGAFRFEFGAPDEVMDRFSLNPSAFILEVGLQAGFLAEEGLADDDDELGLPKVVVDLPTETLRDACADLFRRKGREVVLVPNPERLGAVLGDWPVRAPSPWIVTGLPAEPSEADWARLEAIRAVQPAAALVAVGESREPAVRSRARAAGADAYVPAPRPAELAGPHAEAHLDVFLLQLQRAMEQASAGGPPCAREAEA
ncbi:MAG: DUF4388 domain-containing protein [Candidatus Dadabacteria bacterium]|nr:MAG: DUF4388 domain-containing protein [Candidatus Dadabacteria bacterium]